MTWALIPSARTSACELCPDTTTDGGFIVSDYQRSGTQFHKVPRAEVDAMWKCLMAMERNKRYESSHLYRLFAEEMEWAEFFVKDARPPFGPVFDVAMFRGARDKKTGAKYFRWYYALKVIQYFKLVDYKSHWVTRKSDEFKMNRVADSKLDQF